MEISTSLFDYNKKTKCFSQEISTLCSNVEKGLASKLSKFCIGVEIVLRNPKSEKAMDFICHKVDKDGSNEDIYGWHFVSLLGIRILIVND